jgi:hypothetical protein
LNGCRKQFIKGVKERNGAIVLPKFGISLFKKKENFGDEKLFRDVLVDPPFIEDTEEELKVIMVHFLEEFIGDFVGARSFRTFTFFNDQFQVLKGQGCQIVRCRM